MKHRSGYAIVTLLALLITLPTTAAAQATTTLPDISVGGSVTASSTSNVASSTVNLSQDGSGETRTARRDRIRRYREQSNELRQKIDALGSVASTTVLMPILFGVGVKNIFPNFGDPRDGGSRTHEGEDIMATKGVPIVSPTAAVVLRTGVGGSEGNYVYTANPGGEIFVYMHLDRIGEGVAQGTVLAQGSLIGYVGNTGNASGGPAHLHFEIHNSSNTPVDPFPRLTTEFSSQEKINALSKILTQTSDSVSLSKFLVTNFRTTFVSAMTAGIILPIPINDALATIPASTPSSAAVVTRVGSLPPGELDMDSSGPSVVALQKYLIQKASGSAATRLAQSGATGYFGAITKAALVEYQLAVGILPANGYYGPTTLAFIEAHPLQVSSIPTTTPTTQNTTALALIRDLYRNINGEDVRTLQKLLNANGFIVAQSGAGSPGNETTYFGAATEAAVKKFQESHGISPVKGYVGTLTRAALAFI